MVVPLRRGESLPQNVERRTGFAVWRCSLQETGLRSTFYVFETVIASLALKT
jgi:hypothetical protein